ncbi:AfsA-related hotdog domain-containing protein [Yimella sp. NH-Cas1]|uniref:AfsA-related hotdog domain-containing protein n=1 Tax=Yimella sp. NH-Cas1 TaxID=2917726 RepID=UPI001EFA6459|nr:AfsA-related hotdog domain-containing protein [Yimella sp. NH-Cas1]MCG8656673.1 hypothetical protein [Yimella sp. NH-Cas1]
MREAHQAGGWHGVDRRLVHRSANAEVFVTGTRASEDHIIVTAQWPRTHSLFIGDGEYDLSILMETFRQAAIFATHTHLGAPAASSFVMAAIRVDLHARDALAVGVAPAEIDMVMRVDGARTGDRWRRWVDWEVSYLRDGAPFATAWGRCRAHRTEDFRRLRQRMACMWSSDLPIPAGDPTRCIVAAGNRYRLRVDPADPVLFDHPLDHVPGMLLIEAALQIAADRGLNRRTVGHVAADFSGFVELSDVCEASVTATDPGITVHFEQAGVVRAEIAVRTMTAGDGLRDG